MTVKLHRLGAFLILSFLTIHIGVHITALWGIAAHTAALNAVRFLYQNPFVEPLLVLAVISQIISGVRRVRYHWPAPGKGFWGWAQILSGLYMIYFLLVHVSAALFARFVVGLDTDIRWASAPMQAPGMSLYFTLHYSGALIAIFTHLGAALHFRRPERLWRARSAVVTGVALAAALVPVFAGLWYTIPLDGPYLDLFASYRGALR